MFKCESELLFFFFFYLGSPHSLKGKEKLTLVATVPLNVKIRKQIQIQFIVNLRGIIKDHSTEGT